MAVALGLALTLPGLGKAAEANTDNPFYQPSELPFQMPPFDRIKDEHYAPALERGMQGHRAEIDHAEAHVPGRDTLHLHAGRDGRPGDPVPGPRDLAAGGSLRQLTRFLPRRDRGQQALSAVPAPIRRDRDGG